MANEARPFRLITNLFLGYVKPRWDRMRWSEFDAGHTQTPGINNPGRGELLLTEPRGWGQGEAGAAGPLCNASCASGQKAGAGRRRTVCAVLVGPAALPFPFSSPAPSKAHLAQHRLCHPRAHPAPLKWTLLDVARAD